MGLFLLAHCSFPEYSFDPPEGDEVNAGGSAGNPYAGRGGASNMRGAGGGFSGSNSGGSGTGAGQAGSSGGGTGGSVAGAAGQAGAGGSSGCTVDCEFVVATASAEVFSLVSDGDSVYWSEFNRNNGDCTIFAKDADGGGQVRTVANPGQLPGGQIIVDLRSDDDAIYGMLLDNSLDGDPPHGLVRIPKGGGNAQTLLEVGPDRVLFFFALGDTVAYAFREDDNQPPGAVIRVPKNGG
ncbi:MAG: hypothetical protein MUF34_22495, partial [Polyangiaceae bacterium]|nr:hypothetical protein [Polyangiaceae bacterium]